MSARIDAATLLARALVGDAAKSQVTAVVTAACASRWASATFAGARHRLTLQGPDSAAVSLWLAGLAEAELPLRGHLVADLAVVAQASRDGRFTATIEVLTLEEA